MLPAPAPGPRVADAGGALAVLVASVGVAQGLAARGDQGLPHSGTVPLDAAGAALVLLSALPLLVWRRAPLGVFCLVAGASVALAALDYRVAFPLGATVALYLLASSRSQERPWSAAHTGLAAVLLTAFVMATARAEGRFPGLSLSHTALAWAGAWFAGERTRLRRRQLADLRGQIEASARETEQERRLAVAEERSRIARDLHDAAGHAITVIAVRAGAARLRHAREPERSPVALAAIEDLARQTVTELDHLVGALRDDTGGPGTATAPPGLASLPALVDEHRAAGLDVAVDGRPPVAPLGPAADQAAYRILQEALTNAARHGTGPVHVTLRAARGGVALSVVNQAPAGPAPGAGRGHGLVGMRERAELAGGQLVAGLHAGTFRVEGWLPASAPAAARALPR